MIARPDPNGPEWSEWSPCQYQDIKKNWPVFRWLSSISALFLLEYYGKIGELCLMLISYIQKRASIKMYHFNEIEKHVLNKIVTLQGFQSMFGNLIIKKIDKALIKISPKENKATMELHYYKGDQGERKEDYERLYKHNIELLCTTVSLLDYLLSNHLVYEYGVLTESKAEEDYTLGINHKMGGVQWVIEDKDLVSKIIKYSHKVLIPTTDLKYIIDNNYRTRSEVKFRYQMFATWAAIFVTFLIGIFSIALNGCDNEYETQEKNITTPYSGHSR